MPLGELNERQRQIGRLNKALELGRALTEQVAEIEKAIEPIQARVEATLRATDFDEAESLLSDGVNGYLQAINLLKPNAWPHSRVTVDVTRSTFRIRVGSRRWDKALGGTDTLYFLMAYQYGLLTLSDKEIATIQVLQSSTCPASFRVRQSRIKKTLSCSRSLIS